jgi:hypothetical protein
MELKLELQKTEQDISHEKGEDCEQDDCQECCGEFHGHEYDPDEGGYCYCGAHASESNFE